jgi:hypothetical protein
VVTLNNFDVIPSAPQSQTRRRLIRASLILLTHFDWKQVSDDLVIDTSYFDWKQVSDDLVIDTLFDQMKHVPDKTRDSL